MPMRRGVVLAVIFLITLAKGIVEISAADKDKNDHKTNIAVLMTDDVHKSATNHKYEILKQPPADNSYRRRGKFDRPCTEYAMHFGFGLTKSFQKCIWRKGTL